MFAPLQCFAETVLFLHTIITKISTASVEYQIGCDGVVKEVGGASTGGNFISIDPHIYITR